MKNNKIDVEFIKREINTIIREQKERTRLLNNAEKEVRILKYEIAQNAELIEVLEMTIKTKKP